LKKLILLLLIAFSFVYSSDKRNLLQKGLQLSYNFNFEESEKVFQKLIDDYPDEPEGYLYLSQNYMWSYLGSKEEEEYEKFSKLIEQSIEKLKSKLSSEKQKYEVNYLLGKAYMFKAMALMNKGDNLQAFMSTKSSVDYFNDVIEEKKDFYDAKLGIGVFQYALDFIPPVFKWAVSMTGLTADKEKGLKNIQQAYKMGKESKIEAAFHLGKIYSDYLANYDSSAMFLNSIIAKYPNNTLFLYQCAITQMLNRNLSAAEKLLLKVISLNNPKFKQTTAFAYFLMGDIYFRQNNFEKAINYYEKFLKLTKITDYTGIAYYRLSFCNMMLDKDEKAKKLISLSNAGNDDIQDDIYAKEEGKKIKEYGWSNDRKILQLANNFLESAEYDSVISYLKDKIIVLKDKDFEQIANLHLAEAYLFKKEIKAAEELLKDIDVKNFDREKWGVTYFYVLSAKVFYKLGKKNDVIKYLKLAEDSNDYYFKDKFSAQINGLKRKL
jgi:tetratricopeptide (TPR) repeat protein